MYIFNKKKVLGRAIQPYLKIYVDWLYSITMYVSCIYKYLCTLIQTTSIVRLMVTKRALFDSPSNNLDWRSLAFFLLSHTPKRLHEWKIHKHSYLLITYICIYKKLFILHIPIFAATNWYLNAVKFSPIFSS